MSEQVSVFLELSRRSPLIDFPHRDVLGELVKSSEKIRAAKSFIQDETFSTIFMEKSGRLRSLRKLLRSDDSDYQLVGGTLTVDGLSSVPINVGGNRVLSDPFVDTYVSCLDEGHIGTHNDVADQLDTAVLHGAGLDGEGVAIAIIDTGINIEYLEQKLGFRPAFDSSYSWRPENISVKPGDFPVGHGTMCAYAALLVAPKATLIDVPAFAGTPSGGAVIGRRLGQVFQGIAQLQKHWSIAFTPSGERKYKALALSNSWGMYHSSWDFPQGHPGRYGDNPTHTFNRTISGLSQFEQVDVLFAAGNCGPICPDQKCQGVVDGVITGANALSEVMTVSGCDLDGNHVGYSSVGPGILNNVQQKPDIASFTHFKGSEALGAGKPDKGTSTSCPIAAGCVAALRTKVSPVDLSPMELKKLFCDTAQRSNGNRWNPELGHGIILPRQVAQSLGVL
ncbi:MAG: S8 family serine peptidase [Gammaproteobacteria bacterium]|nr:S8 family serine peptidase [Gammaproteobacteria bacterium]NKB63446.1 S8 family serine peptidase [Gammaproteobacteria bacterium]